MFTFYLHDVITFGINLLQYVPHTVSGRRVIFDRFALLIVVAIVWLYAYILTVAGAYKNRPPQTQISCRTNRSGLIGASPWYCNSRPEILRN